MMNYPMKLDRHLVLIFEYLVQSVHRTRHQEHIRNRRTQEE